jgi:serine protease Do
MTQTTDYATQSSFPLPDAFSSALTTLFETVQPGIVQVRTEQRGGGTGVIWHSDGRIITNNHVVGSDTANVQVHLSDGRTLPAKVLHRNPQLDLALLQVHAGNLHPLPAGDSDKLRIGEWVFAIGHPWGQRWALTAGIVSTIRSLKIADDLATSYIQSDVRLAPGNSGGPLLDADGNVVGINAMIFGGDLSVAIPSNVVRAWLAELPRRRVMLGAELQTIELSGVISQSLQPQRSSGLLVVGTRAREEYLTDLLVGDILLDVAGKPVSDVATLRQILQQYREGDAVPMHILRGGNIVAVDIATQAME